MNEKLRQQLTEIEKLQMILHEQAIQDPLTGLYNRRYMEEALKQEHARAARDGQAFSVVMVDMNDLKKINDGYGHIMGDEAIKQAGNLLKERIRAEDIACRYGGDEFLVILHNASSETARQCTQQWENRAKELSITSKNKKIPISFSVGVATYPTDSSHIEELILLADASLYAAKSKRSY
jgi:diguanylate cyclase (GGDEF)-like protein